MFLRFSFRYLLVLFSLLITVNAAFSIESSGDNVLPAINTSSQDIFVNVSTLPSTDAILVKWSIHYDQFYFLKENGYSIVIHYKLKKDLVNDWQSIDNIPIDATGFSIEKLKGNADYELKLGVNKGGVSLFTDVLPARTKLPWGIFYFIVLIGSLGLFVYGMKVMGEGLQQNLGSKLRNQLGSITSNRFRAIITGFSITAIVQSVIASIVMIVSFVNAGLLTLSQSAGLMLGASVGAAVTTWFINLLAFEIDLSAYALFILAFTAPLLFFGKKRWKPWINTIFGFVFLVMGLSFMIANMPEHISEVPYLSQLISWIEIPVFGVLIFVVVGALFSVFLQSTVATIAFTMVLVYVSIVPFEAAIAMILGANVGTAINVEFASSAGNVHAKRSARIHSLFQLFGLIWALLLFPFILEGIQWLMLNLGWGDPIRYSADFGNTGLAIFHTIFNVTNALVLVWLIPNFVRLGERMVKSKGRSDEVFHLEFIGTGLLSTADLSILEAKKEIAKFGNLTIRMSTMTRSLLFEKNTREFEATLNRIKKYEDITDRIEIEVVKYLNKLSEGDLTLQTASRIRGMNSMVNDLERIGDIFYQMSKTIERKTNEKLWFTPEQRNNLSQQFDLVDEALEIMCENLVAHHDKVSLEKANDAERKINEKRNDLRKAYLEGLSNQDSNFKAGMVYNDLFSSLEKVGDHIINVSEAVVGKV
jgi:phosphate:Na+ symporter